MGIDNRIEEVGGWVDGGLISTTVFQPESGEVTWCACLINAAWLVVDYIPGGKLVNVAAIKDMRILTFPRS